MEKDRLEEELRALYEEVINHPVITGHYSVLDVRLNGEPLLESDTVATAKGLPDLDAEVFAHLFLLMDGGNALTELVPEEKATDTPEGWYVKTNYPATGHTVVSSVGLYDIENEPTLHLHLDQLRLSAAAPERLGTFAFFLCAATAYRLRLKMITLTAAGNPQDEDWNGYAFWPKVGFDGDLKPSEQRGLRRLGTGAKTVQEAEKQRPGWWEGNGSQQWMEFHLAPTCESWDIMLAYVRKKLQE